MIFLGKVPGAELASHVSVGHGAVAEAGKGVPYIRKVDMWVIQKQTRIENQTCFRRPFKHNCHPATQPCTVLLIACIEVWRV